MHWTVAIVLALATLSGAIQIGSFIFLGMPPKVTKASTVQVMDHLHWQSLKSDTVSDSDMRQSLMYLH